MKHIGRHGDRKVAIVYKKIPDQDHMALVVYTESLGANMHDALMKAIESKEGQAENELSDILFRNLFPDGRKMLETLHSEGKIKKVESKQIIVTPDAKNSIKLDELNRILAQIESGGKAEEELANLDKNSGLVDPREQRMQSEALQDSTIAKQNLDQAVRMENESKELLAESKRLIKEAYKLDSSLKPKAKKKVVKKKVAKKTPISKKTSTTTKVNV